MKRYIKAAYDPSMPDWLKFKSDGNKYALEFLNNKYAMSQAKFYKEPQPDSIPIHLLYEIYKEEHRYRDPHYKTKMNEYVYVPDGHRNSEIIIETAVATVLLTAPIRGYHYLLFSTLPTVLRYIFLSLRQ